MRTSRLRVTLRYVTPPVLRLVDVPKDSTLPELHWLLVAAMGWQNTHLHMFDNGFSRWGPDPEEDFYEDEEGVRLDDLGNSFRYDYDFGDSWEHDVEVLGAGGEGAGLVEGAGDCPPEDCGGVPGYEELRTVLADPRHPDYSHLSAWAEGQRGFDAATTDRLVKEVAGEVPGSVRLLLDLVGDGVRLTPGGRLPRSIVRAVQDQRPEWYRFGDRPASIEEDLIPLAALHEVARGAGLLRLQHGVLKPTKAAGSNQETVRRLRRWRADQRYPTMLTSMVISKLAIAGPLAARQLSAAVAAVLDPRWQGASGPLTAPEIESDLRAFRPEWEALDLLHPDAQPGQPELWTAGPSARTLLPRVALVCAHTGSSGDD